jgi:F-type H+-transporting ATPase subunit b
MEIGTFSGIFYLKPIFYVAVAFVIFFALFGKKVMGALTHMLDDRIETIRTELDEAKRLRREAETMLNDAKVRREAALADAEHMLKSAQSEAARLTEAARAEAEALGRRREHMAMDRIAAAEKAAVAQVRQTAADVATAAAQHVISTSLTTETGAALVDRAITALPASLSMRRAAA